MNISKNSYLIDSLRMYIKKEILKFNKRLILSSKNKSIQDHFLR
jgi:hypothetical protein